MNTMQINCFLTSAKLLNFTKAADQLHITQPAMSRQIVSLEHEIGANLFIRERNTVHLTEAGKILAEGLQDLMNDYNELVDKAVSVARGLRGGLNIATVIGQTISGIFSDTLLYLWRNNPELQVQVSYYNISKHLQALQSRDVDMVIITETELEGVGKEVCRRPVRSAKSCLVVPATHPFANKENARMADFEGETFIRISSSESERLSALQESLCMSAGFVPSSRVAPNIATVAVWLESGVGITTLNRWHMLASNPNLKFIEMDELLEVREYVAWLEDNHNPAIQAFLNALEVCTQEEKA